MNPPSTSSPLPPLAPVTPRPGPTPTVKLSSDGVRVEKILVEDAAWSPPSRCARSRCVLFPTSTKKKQHPNPAAAVTHLAVLRRDSTTGGPTSKFVPMIS